MKIWVPDISLPTARQCCVILFAVFIFLSHQLPAAQSFPSDTSKVEIRTPSGLEEYRKMKEFQYEREVVKTQSWWDKFWEWFFDKLGEKLNTRAADRIFVFLRWALIIFGVVFLLAWLFNGEIKGLFYRNRKFNNLSGVYEDLSKPDEDIEKAILDALRDNNYSLAVRWYYIRSLKLLSEKGFVTFKPDKTNSDYVYELKDQRIAASFKRLTYFFEYSNYGDFKISEVVHGNAREVYQKLTGNLE